MFDVAHGAGLTAVWGSWARLVYGERLDRFAKFATNVMNVPWQGNERETAVCGIYAAEAFFQSIGMPVTLAELGIAPTEEQIDALAEKCMKSAQGMPGIVKKLSREDIAGIYRAAM